LLKAKIVWQSKRMGLFHQANAVICIVLMAAVAGGVVSCRCGEEPIPKRSVTDRRRSAQSSDAGKNSKEAELDVRMFPSEAEALAAILAEAKPAILGLASTTSWRPLWLRARR